MHNPSISIVSQLEQDSTIIKSLIDLASDGADDSHSAIFHVEVVVRLFYARIQDLVKITSKGWSAHVFPANRMLIHG